MKCPLGTSSACHVATLAGLKPADTSLERDEQAEVEPRRVSIRPGMTPLSDRVPEGADLLIRGHLKPATKRHDVSRCIFKEFNQAITIGTQVFC